MNKICYFNLVTYSHVGGIENYNKTFLKGLDYLEEKTTAVSVYDKEAKQEYKNVDFMNFDKNKVKASVYVLKNVYKIEKLIVAHINLLPIVMIAKILKPSLKIYLLIYGIEVWERLPYVYRLFLNKISILSISRFTTNTFTKYNNIKPDNIFYLPPDTEIKVKEKFDNVYNSDEFNILSVTRLDSNDSYKGVDSMIRTLPLLIKKISNIKYTIVGKGNDQERLEILAVKLGVEQYIDFKGFVEFIEPYYQYCDIFALPSKGEGFGIVYIEAMLHRKACIACDEGGQTDVVIDNVTGFLCKYDDIKCLSLKISTLFKDKKKREVFGSNGYAHLIDKFTFKSFTNRLKRILNA